MPKHNSEDYKLSAVKYYLKIDNQTKICEIFKCSERSLMRWVDKYKKVWRITKINFEKRITY
jgi:transposase-like protein